MTAWVVRGGRQGEYESEALDNGFLCIGYGLDGDMSGVSGQDGFTEILRRLHPSQSPNQISGHAGQVRSFVERIEPGDLAIMPRKGTNFLAVGVFQGGYHYRPDKGPFAQSRRVEWLNMQVRRDQLDDDLKISTSSDLGVFRPRAERAEERLRALAEHRRPAEVRISAKVGAENGEPVEDEPDLDVEEYVSGQIREHVERYFHGHALSNLVAAVLEAEDYRVSVSSPGPDGGVDILAGKGPMGFESPRICVQVKSGNQVTGVEVLRQLQGVMQKFQADHGLMVSWNGFARPAEQEAKAMYFNIRLWDSGQLLEAVLKNYELLSPGIRSALPLKRLWALVQEETV